MDSSRYRLIKLLEFWSAERPPTRELPVEGEFRGAAHFELTELLGILPAAGFWTIQLSFDGERASGEVKPRLLRRNHWELPCEPAEVPALLERFRRGEFGRWDALLFQRARGEHWSGLFSTMYPSGSFAFAESLLDQFPSLDSFLGDEHALSQYYCALCAYYENEDIPHERFRLVLAQLREMRALVPELSERLWAVQEDASFTIEPELKTYGRRVDAVRWEARRATWEHELRARVPEWLRPESDADQRDPELKRVAQELTERIRVFEERVAKLRKREQRLERARFFKQEAENPVLHALADMAVASHLRFLTDVSDTDLLLFRIGQMHEDPRQSLAYLRYLWHDIPVLLSLIKKRVPPLSDFLKDVKTFVPVPLVSNRGRKSVQGSLRAVPYTFRTLRRKLHGVWRGLPIYDCTAGVNAEWITPARWALTALQGERFWHVERASRYQGMIFAVPVQVDGQRYFSMEIYSPIVMHPFMGSGGSTSLVLEQFLMKTGLPMIVGESKMINFAPLLHFLRLKDCYQRGRVVGDRSQVSFDDPIAGRIIEVCQKKGYSTRYGEGMLVDASLPDAGELRLLTSEPASPASA
ncbi:MAG: hypothetical protein ACXWPM_07630, partial [Bdellovibrionota bacterium]